MIDVALHQKARPVALTEISRRQKISVSYLEQLFANLRRHGLVTATRGPGGGYRIARTAQTITVADVINAVDHAYVEPRNTRADPSSADEQRCLASELWTSLHQRMTEVLESIHLQQLMDDQVGIGIHVEIKAICRAAPVKPRVVKPRPRGPNSVFDLADASAD